MNVALYFICLFLLLPMAGFAAFGFLIDSLTQVGFWEVFKAVFSPLYDPFGKGLWFFAGLLSVAGLCGAGFFPEARIYGFGAMAAIGIGCVAFVLRVYPNDWGNGSVILFIPSVVSVGLSVYCVVKPLR